MFTGIIQTIGTVIEVIQKKDLLSYALDFPHDHLQLGASVSVDGVCQTVVHMEGDHVWFDAIAETLKRTTLGILTAGQKVNIERAAKIGDEIGGHLLSGHIYDTARLHQVEGNIYRFECSPDCMKYLFSKGFIAIDGISLTLVEVKENFFTVHLIPETLKRTTLGTKKVGDRINLELDTLTQAVVETVERMTSSG